MKKLLFTALLVSLGTSAFAQVPNRKALVEQVARDNPNAFACAHTPAACGHDFIKLVACKLAQLPAPEGPRWGLNGKRGNPTDLSWDALNWRGYGPGHDPTNGNQPVTVIDVIAAAGSPQARVEWTVFDDLPGPGAWVQPGENCKPPVSQPPVVIPPVQLPVVQPYPDENAWWGAFYEQEVTKLYAEAKLPFPDNSASFRWFTRVAYDIRDGMTKEAAAAKHLAQLRKALGLP